MFGEKKDKNQLFQRRCSSEPTDVFFPGVEIFRFPRKDSFLIS